MEKITEVFMKLFKSRKIKYGTNTIILIAAVIAIVVILNILVGMADIKWDLTPNKLYSLTDTTKDILKNLEKDVIIYGLFDDGVVGDDYKEVTQLLKHYEKYPRVNIEYIDPEKNPTIIKELDPDNIIDIQKHDFIVKSGNKVKKLEYYDLFSTRFDQQSWREYKVGSTAEQGFTGAIKYVTADKTPVVYFTTGHDEYKIESDYQSVKTYLDRNNYDVKEINLVTQEKVPEDAELIIVGSPKRDFSKDEQDIFFGTELKTIRISKKRLLHSKKSLLITQEPSIVSQ
jgi:ABC-2 type transport system permease protein